jgi:hypothetical protein
VVEFRRFIVATDGDYAEMVDGQVRHADLTFDGFRVPGTTAAIIVTEHRCDAITALVRVMTGHGGRAFAEHEAGAVSGGRDG